MTIPRSIAILKVFSIFCHHSGSVISLILKQTLFWDIKIRGKCLTSGVEGPYLLRGRVVHAEEEGRRRYRGEGSYMQRRRVVDTEGKCRTSQGRTSRGEGLQIFYDIIWKNRVSELKLCVNFYIILLWNYKNIPVEGWIMDYGGYGFELRGYYNIIAIYYIIYAYCTYLSFLCVCVCVCLCVCVCVCVCVCQWMVVGKGSWGILYSIIIISTKIINNNQIIKYQSSCFLLG